MQPAQSGRFRRLPITARVEPLRLIIYSTSDDRRAALTSAIHACTLLAPERDKLMEVPTPDAARGLTLGEGACLIVDTASPPLPPQVIGERGVSCVVISAGERPEDDSDFDGHLSVPPEAAQVSRILRRARELSWLRARSFGTESRAGSRDRLARLNRIGTALSEFRQLDRLLEFVLSEARNVLDADAGSIYILERGTGASPGAPKALGRPERMTRAVAVRRDEFSTRAFSLRFAAAQNDSVTIPFEEIVFPADLTSIAGYAALTGEILAIDDVYRPVDGAPWRFNPAIDDRYGYRTRSMLTVPLKNTRDEVVGVVQLINRKRDPRRRLTLNDTGKLVIPFSGEDMEIAASLGSQAGVAIENVRLMDSIANLFERFVVACVRAIEQRDPSTAGHSGRVDRITMALADAVNRADSGPYRDVAFSDTEMTELHYAALLHDFGKIGVREHVLTKAEKLYPVQSQAISFRAELIRRELRLKCLEHEARLHAEGKADPASLGGLRDTLTAELAALDADLDFVRRLTRPDFVPEEDLERLRVIHARRWGADEGVQLISDDEYRSLATRRGTLTDEERREIENHVADSWQFLKQIPWTPDLSRVPEIAGQHHEKMNGKGYPNGVPAATTPLGSRLIAVADVFDSLTASDRPYKPAIPLERALEILRAMVRDGELDPDVVALFESARIWEKLKLKVVRLADATDSQRAAK